MIRSKEHTFSEIISISTSQSSSISEFLRSFSIRLDVGAVFSWFIDYTNQPVHHEIIK